MINNKNKFVILAIYIAIFLWFLEVILHVFVFKTGDFIDELTSFQDVDELWMRVVIISVVILAGIISQKMADTISESLEREREINFKLETSLKEIKFLRGILPICASCKKIRDDNGYWNQVEAYISDHSEAQFTHSVCPACAEKLYPGLNPYKKGNNSLHEED